MQTYMLAERLRRVENAPLTQEMIKFPFKHLPTDFLEKPENQTCNVSCEACSTAVPIDGGKKYCARFQVTVYCSKACQKADWKRHKKVCGKEPEKDVLDGKDKQAYKADMNVTSDYLSSVPGLGFFCKLLFYIHWNDSPVIGITTLPGTDGMNPTVIVMPKSYWGPRYEERNPLVTKFYKDGPTKYRFIAEYALHHLGPELAKKSSHYVTEMKLPNDMREFLGADHPSHIMVEDLPTTMAEQVQLRGLVKYVQSRTALPTSVDEMTAFHNSHMNLQGSMVEHRARMNMNE